MTQGSGEIQDSQRSARPRNALEGGPESHQCCGSSGGATDSSALQYKQQCGKDVNRWYDKGKDGDLQTGTSSGLKWGGSY